MKGWLGRPKDCLTASLTSIEADAARTAEALEEILKTTTVLEKRSSRGRCQATVLKRDRSWRDSWTRRFNR